MKKLFLVLAVVSLLSGCAFYKDQQANWKACAADPVCFAEAKESQAKWEKIGGFVGDGVGAVPFVPPTAAKYAGIGGKYVFGYGALALAMLLGGKALRKKKENG